MSCQSVSTSYNPHSLSEKMSHLRPGFLFQRWVTGPNLCKHFLLLNHFVSCMLKFLILTKSSPELLRSFSFKTNKISSLLPLFYFVPTHGELDFTKIYAACLLPTLICQNVILNFFIKGKTVSTS